MEKATVKTTVQASLPIAQLPQPPAIEVQSLATILPTIPKSDGTPIVTYNQALVLTSLKFQQGDPILTLEDRPFVYEIVNMIDKLGYDRVYNFLNVDWEKIVGPGAGIRKRIIFENPLLDPSKERMEMDMEIFRSRVDVSKGAVNCKRCGSEETLSVEKQTRSADEPMTVRVRCLQCDYVWTAQ